LGEQAADGILGELRAARFVEQTADRGWLLARDLKAASLLDLLDALKLGIGESLGQGTALAPALGDCLADARRRSRDALAVSLDDLIDTRPAKQKKEAAKAGLRPIS
jgi:hypothetical protein